MATVLYSAVPEQQEVGDELVDQVTEKYIFFLYRKYNFVFLFHRKGITKHSLNHHPLPEQLDAISSTNDSHENDISSQR